jgi:FMN-dependent NADH-azoreductase
MKLLHIDSSITGAASASRQLTREIVARWRAVHPALEVKYLDLAAEPLPHLSAVSLGRADAAQAARDAAMLADFQSAEVIVVGAPMYNFTIPTQLKAWIDRIAVAGQTFRYTAAGPEGLAGGKRVIVALSRGSVYPEAAAAEHAETYLRALFGFLGVKELTFVRAEGLAISPESRNKALSAALASIAVPELGIAA